MAFLNTSSLKEDFFGGINAGIVAIPVALAFGAAAGLEPINGLYGAIILGFLAAFLGGTPTLISNPTGPMAVVTGLIVAGQVAKAGSLAAAMPIIVMIFFMAGVFQVVFGLVKFGKYVHYIPHPVVSGFMSGIGAIIIILQTKNFFGISGKYGVTETLANLDVFVQNANWISVALALLTIVLIYVVPKLTKAVPSTLVALVIVTSISYFADLPSFGISIIGAIPSSLPKIEISYFTDLKVDHLSLILLPAFSLAALGMIDSLLTAVVADKLTKSKHNSDKELLGQGIGNMVAALFGGIPGAGTTPSTVLNIKSGARTRLSGIIHAVFLLIVLLVGGPVAAQIPHAALAGILITIGISILDFEAVRNFKSVPKTENIIMILVLVLTVFWSLLYAVGLGLIIAAFVFMKNMADVVEGESKDTKVDRIVDQLIHSFDNAEEFKKQVLIKNLKGPIFFGFASRFQDSMDEVHGVKAVLINFSGVTYMDQSGMYTFQEAVQRLTDRGINVVISEVQDGHLNLLKGIKVVPDLIDEEHVFSSVEECIMWLNEPGHIDNEFVADGELYIPSAYTPNGDGINDEWEIRNIDKYPSCMVRIFNREGVKIFESEGYYNMWEGIYKGDRLPTDRYKYEIDLYGNGEDVRSGNVSIFR